MKLVSFLHHAEPKIGVHTEDGVVPTDLGSLNELLTLPDAANAHIISCLRQRRPLLEPQLAAPTTNPGKMLFCGVNYEDHLEEVPQIPRPAEPFFFAKLPNTIIATGQPVRIPRADMAVDYEAELAVVIGRRARHVKPDHALDYVFGYTAVNDVTARDIQFTDNQITLGKGIDGFCPMGPGVTTADSMSPEDVRVSCTVNGEVRQDASTKLLIASVPELISYLSETITLMPGDVIATGTPAGVGHFKDPPQTLKPGDVVTVTVEGVGSITNEFVQGW